jgi:hypothetical protein
MSAAAMIRLSHGLVSFGKACSPRVPSHLRRAPDLIQTSRRSGIVLLAVVKAKFGTPQKCAARIALVLAAKFATEGGLALSPYAVENPDDGTVGRNREGRVLKGLLRPLSVNENLVGGWESVGAEWGHPGDLASGRTERYEPLRQ